MIVAVVGVRLRRSWVLLVMMMLLLSMWLMLEVIVEMVIAVPVMRRMLLMGVRDRQSMIVRANNGSSAARARRQLLRGDRRALNLCTAQTRTSALMIRGRRGAGRRERVHLRWRRGIHATGIAAVATRLTLHQKFVVINVTRHRRPAAGPSHGKIGLIGSAVGSTAVTVIVGHDGRWDRRRGNRLTNRLLLMMVGAAASLMMLRVMALLRLLLLAAKTISASAIGDASAATAAAVRR